jgi:hypothetical protein
MKIKLLAVGLIISSAMVLTAGPIQARVVCFKNQPGWHMVSKRCAIQPARNWQEYAGGVYLQPMGRTALFMRR